MYFTGCLLSSLSSVCGCGFSMQLQMTCRFNNEVIQCLSHRKAERGKKKPFAQGDLNTAV